MKQFTSPVYKTSRRFFTLIEVLIALGLTTLIMSTLTYFYFQIQTINNKTEQSLKKLYGLSYLENRLMEVIPKALAENSSKNEFFFYTTDVNNELSKPGSPSLVFMYDNGIDINKALSNNTLGKLFVSTKGELILATLPSPKRWKEGTPPPMIKEVLIDNVESISLSFFVAPAMERGRVSKISSAVEKKKLYKPEPPLTWIKDWKYEFYELPAMMKLIIQRPNEKIEYTFPLPNSTRTLYYTQ